jgi:hypothetical protein
MNTSQQGTIGETKVIHELALKGYPIFKEIGNHSKTDLIAIVNNRCIKIQVKVGTQKDGYVTIRLFGTGKYNGKIRYVYTKNDFDVLAVYISTIDKVVFLNWNDIKDSKSVTLRYDIQNNKQKNNPYLRHTNEFLGFEKCLENGSLA